MLTYFLIILLTLFFISVYIFTSLKDRFTSQKQIEYTTHANIIANLTADYINVNDSLIPSILKNENVSKETRLIILDKEAKVVYDNADTSPLIGKTILNGEVTSALKGTDKSDIVYDKNDGWTFNIAVKIMKDKQIVGIVYMLTSAKETMDIVNDLMKSLVLISILVSVLIGILSAIFAGIITEPLEKLTKQIIEISKSGNIHRLATNRKDEIGQLAAAFNNLSDQLNEIDAMRKEFVANVSHEFKTPLATIKLLSDSIIGMDERDAFIINEFLTDINGEVDRLTNITSNLLELTKTDANQIKISKSHFSLSSLIEKIIYSLKQMAENGNVTVTYANEQEYFIYADYDKLWHILFNIIDNGIKYTNEGGSVHISFRSDEKYTVIFVKDTGIGIPQNEMRKIFERFYRVDKARNRETGGTGLGLSIAKNYAELHGGRIEVASNEGEGTVFKIFIPNLA